MGTSKGGGKPFEISHRHIIADPEIQEYISNCEIPFEGKDVKLDPSLRFNIEPPEENSIDYIISVDGGYSTVTVKKNFPSSLISFFQFGSLLIERKQLEDIQAMPFIDPKDMAELKKLTPEKLVLPTKNLLLKGQTSLTFAVRKAIYNFFNRDRGDDEGTLNKTLYWFLFQKYKNSKRVFSDCNCSFSKSSGDEYLHSCKKCDHKAYQLSKCPTCGEPSVLLEEKKMDKNTHSWNCPTCNSEIFLTDVFRLFEAVDDELGASGVLSYVLYAVENLLIVHVLKKLLSLPSSFIERCLIVKDGPLSFAGQTANMFKPMRTLLNFIRKDYHVNIVGVEKSGAFVDHAKEIAPQLQSGQVFLLNNKHIYKYIQPSSGSPETDEYGRTSYYSGKFIYKSKEDKIYVLTVPVSTHNYYNQPEIGDLNNIHEILHNIDLLKCDIYQDAIIPIALVNKLISISNFPSSNILENFTKQNMSE